jgi:hypothetical protein
MKTKTAGVVTGLAVDECALRVGIVTAETIGLNPNALMDRLIQYRLDSREVVTVYAVLTLGEKEPVRELVTVQAMHLYLRGVHPGVLIVAFHADLLRGLEDVETQTMAIDAIRGLIPLEEVDLVTRRACDLPPATVVTRVTFHTELVVDLGDLGHVLGVLRQDLDDVAEALDHVALMALVAVQVVHGAYVPRLVRGVHQVAGRAELRVVLRVVVDEKGRYRYDQQRYRYDKLVPPGHLGELQPIHFTTSPPWRTPGPS